MTVEKKYIAFDTETTGFRKHEGDQIFSYVLTDWSGKSSIHRIPWTPNSLDFQRHDNFLYLQEFWNDTSIVKIMHNAKFDAGFCIANGIVIPDDTEMHDTMLMSQFLQNLSASHALDYLAELIYKYRAPIDKQVDIAARALQRAYKKENPNARIGLSCYQFVAESLMEPYQIADGERTQLLYKCFAPKLFSQPAMWNDYLNEIALILPTARMEACGILIDERQSKLLKDKLARDLSYITKTAKENIGRIVNFNSSEQVVEFMTKDLGLKITKTTTKGKPSASKDVLLGFKDEHDIIDMILKYRAYGKGITAIDSYLELMDPKTKLIHANIKTNHAVTGRQSCSEPNLQNVSKEVSMKTVYAIPARRCFRSTPGFVQFLVDYAGIELRLIVSESGEQEFIDAMSDGKDVHDMASGCLYGDNWEEVNYLMKNPSSKLPSWIGAYISDIIAKDRAKGGHVRAHNDPSIFKQIRKTMRDGAKQFEFGVAYGGGYDAVTHDLLGLDNSQRRDGYKRFEKRWPKIFNFTPNIIRQVRENGYITTAFGRKLYVRKSQAYTGSNYLIQGTAQGILKRGQVRIDTYAKHELDYLIQPQVPIHDELIISYSRELLPYKELICPDIAFMMCHHPEIKVPLEVEWKMTTSNWAAARSIHIETAPGWSFTRSQLLKV